MATRFGFMDMIGKMARRGWHRIIFCIGLVYAVWAFAVFNAVALLLAPVVPRRWRGTVGRRWVWVMSRLSLNVLRGLGGIRCDARDLRALAHIRNTVVVANHPSLMDAMLFTAYLPDLVCVTKQSLLDHPFCGAALRLAQYPGNDTPLRLIRSTVAHARAGQPILLFPEGTRSGRAQVNDAFHPAFAAIAMQAGCTVQIMVITSTSPYLRKGASLLRRPALPITYTVTRGATLPPQATHAMTSRELAGQVQAWLTEALARQAPHGGMA